MRAGESSRPAAIAISRPRQSPVWMQAGPTAARIITLFARLASCSVSIASSASGTSARTWAAPAITSCARMGLRFWGIVEEPTVPGGTGSRASSNSCFISV